MKTPDCETIRDRLPEWAAESIPTEEVDMVETHLPSCLDCRRESELVLGLRDSRPQAPTGLEARIQARVREEFETKSAFSRRRWVPTWALSAAAVVVLALGIGVIWNPGDSDPVQGPIVVASQDLLPEAWLWDDGMIAGAPVFDGLSDEELEALLEEFEG